MAIRRLDETTSRNLFSTQIIPTFEAAVYGVALNSVQQGATQVDITILPTALRFTVTDNGRGFSHADWSLALKPGCTSLGSGRGQSLASLAAVSTVELHSRRGKFFATKLVRSGSELASTSCQDSLGTQSLHPHLQTKDGTVVDVWELFHALPVRLRVETAREEAEVIDATRDKIVSLSLANPTVKFALQGGNGLTFYACHSGGFLSVDMIQTAFGNTASLDWRRVCGKAVSITIHGFIARRGCSSPGICLISLDGVPLQEKGWLHKTVRRAWKIYISGRVPESGTWNRFPAFVLNCAAIGKSHALTRERSALKASPSDRMESILLSVIQDALIGETLNRHTSPNKQVIQREASPSLARKRKLLTAEERFAEALINNRTRRPESSLLASKRSRVALIRPLSAPSLSSAPIRFQGQLRARRISARRPASAERVEAAYRKHLPNWTNPCFQSTVGPCRVAAEVCDTGFGSSHTLFERRRISIRQGAIPNLKVVGQVDCKFIVVVDEKLTMYAIDQHAASERYMYEYLLRKTVRRKPVSHKVYPPRIVQLSHKQFIATQSHRDTLSQWGWHLRSHEGSRVIMERAPHLHEFGDVLDGEEDLRMYLDSLVQGAVKNSIPRPLMNAIASAACHAAVRFGDRLTTAQCRSLVGSLAECESPFTCAHGRPSIVPLAVFERSSDSNQQF